MRGGAGWARAGVPAEAASIRRIMYGRCHVGGAFPYGARRAIRYGDGWIPTARGDIADVLPKFREIVREAGRDLASIEVTLFGLGEDLDRVSAWLRFVLARWAYKMWLRELPRMGTWSQR